jgi:hypothetical protein
MVPESACTRRWRASTPRSAACPDPGRGATVLLAAGNIGIGADPPALVRRTRNLPMPGIVVAVARTAGASSREHARRRTAARSVSGSAFLVGIDQIGGSPPRPACVNEARPAASPAWSPLGSSALVRDRGRS